MLIDNLLEFQMHHILSHNEPGTGTFYYLDYDERFAGINMEFQHFHPFYEILIFLDNAANHFIEGTPYAISCCDMVLLRPSVLHKSEYFEGAPSKRLVIQFQAEDFPAAYMEEYRELLTAFDVTLPIYRFERKVLEEIFAPLNDICHATYKHPEYSRLFVANKLLEFLLKLGEHRYENIYRPKVIEGSSHKIYEVASYIHNHYMNELSLSFLASKFYMNTCYLSHQFKDVTGFTLINYIQMTRIRNAQQMLLFTDKKITDIAEDCGFNSFSQFNRMFNKFCSVSPREFKNYTKTKKEDQTSLDIPFDPHYNYQ